MKVCLWCMWTRHLKTAQAKIEEWKDTPGIATTYRKRVYYLTNELEGLRCLCSPPKDGLSEDQEAA